MLPFGSLDRSPSTFWSLLDMTPRLLARSLLTLLLSCAALSAFAQTESPDALVKNVSTDVLATIKADPSIQSGDLDKVTALVNTKILPYFDFARMTQSATGPRWNDATAQQKTDLEEQFKLLLIRVYAGALERARDRDIAVKPLRAPPTGGQTVVSTEVVGRGEPIKLDFRLAQTGTTWKVVDMNVGGVWLVDNYRTTFAQQIQSGGIDGLIATLKQKNQGPARS